MDEVLEDDSSYCEHSPTSRSETSIRLILHPVDWQGPVIRLIGTDEEPKAG